MCFGNKAEQTRIIYIYRIIRCHPIVILRECIFFSWFTLDKHRITFYICIFFLMKGYHINYKGSIPRIYTYRNSFLRYNTRICLTAIFGLERCEAEPAIHTLGYKIMFVIAETPDIITFWCIARQLIFCYAQRGQYTVHYLLTFGGI